MKVLLSTGLKTWFSVIRKTSIPGLALITLLPAQVLAFSCNSQLEIATDATEFSEKDRVKITVRLGAGKISGGSESALTIDAFHFGTDCSGNDVFPSCTGQGNTISYVPGSVESTCLDSEGKQIEFDVQGGLILDFVPGSDSGPVHQRAGTTCLISFEVMIDEFVSPPGDSSIVFQAGGWQRSEGKCDNGFNSDGTASVGFMVKEPTTPVVASGN